MQQTAAHRRRAVAHEIAAGIDDAGEDDVRMGQKGETRDVGEPPGGWVRVLIVEPEQTNDPVKNTFASGADSVGARPAGT